MNNCKANHKFSILVLTVFCFLTITILGRSESAYSEDAECVRADAFIQALSDATSNPDSYFYQAIHTGHFMMHNNWLYGIIDKNNNYTLTFLLSDNQDDAVILSGRLMLKRSQKGDPKTTYDQISEELINLRTEITTLANEASHNNRPWGFPLPVNEYCSLNYYVQDLIFYDHDYLPNNERRTDSYGNNIQTAVYIHPGSTMGELLTTVQKLLPEIDEATIDSYYVGSDIDPYREYYEISDEQFKTLSSFARKVYRISTENAIVDIICDKDSQYVESMSIKVTWLADKEMFHTCMELFFKIVSKVGQEQMIDYLATLHGETFAWENYLSKKMAFKTGHISVPVPSFYLYGWEIRFDYDIQGLPVMKIVYSNQTSAVTE